MHTLVDEDVNKNRITSLAAVIEYTSLKRMICILPPVEFKFSQIFYLQTSLTASAPISPFPSNPLPHLRDEPSPSHMYFHPIWILLAALRHPLFDSLYFLSMHYCDSTLVLYCQADFESCAWWANRTCADTVSQVHYQISDNCKNDTNSILTVSLSSCAWVAEISKRKKIEEDCLCRKVDKVNQFEERKAWLAQSKWEWHVSAEGGGHKVQPQWL